MRAIDEHAQYGYLFAQQVGLNDSAGALAQRGARQFITAQRAL